jgi:hypothetical protein
MVTSPKGLGPEKDYTGEASGTYKKQTSSLVREGAPGKQDLSKNNKYLVMSRRWGSTPRLID